MPTVHKSIHKKIKNFNIQGHICNDHKQIFDIKYLSNHCFKLQNAHMSESEDKQ